MTHEPNGWYVRAKVSAASAIDLYERGSVEHELALYLSRALREYSRLVDAAKEWNAHYMNLGQDSEVTDAALGRLHLALARYEEEGTTT